MISSGRPIRRAGIVRSIHATISGGQASLMSVAKGPGSKQLTLTSGANDRASPVVRLLMPAFAMP